MRRGHRHGDEPRWRDGHAVHLVHRRSNDIYIDATGSPTVSVLVDGDANDVIRSISVQSNDDAGIAGISNVELTVRKKTGATLGLSRVESITQVAGAGELFIVKVDVDGNIGSSGTTPGGTIKGNYINEVIARAGGHVTATVETVNSVLTRPDIVKVESISGNIYGTIRALGKLPAAYVPSAPYVDWYGWIGQVLANGSSPNGQIGVTGAPATITQNAPIIEMKSREMNVNIAAALGVTGIGAGIQRLEVTGGDLKGNIQAGTAYRWDGGKSQGIVVSGDLQTDLRIDTSASVPISFNSIATGKVLRIGWLKSTGSITLGSAGLVGQVHLDPTLLQSGPTGAWDGTITVGGTTLSTIPEYTQTSLGGGAVGTYNGTIYRPDCTPAEGAVLSSPPSVVVLRHYVPVSLYTVNGSNFPYVVERQSRSGGGAWSDVSSQFEIDNSSSGGRAVGIKPKAGNAYQADSIYRMKTTNPAQPIPPVTPSYPAVYCSILEVPYLPAYYFPIIYSGYTFEIQ